MSRGVLERAGSGPAHESCYRIWGKFILGEIHPGGNGEPKEWGSGVEPMG